jgi:hypothetical protein
LGTTAIGSTHVSPSAFFCHPSGRLSRATAYRSCSEIVKLSGFATWREDQEDSPRHCGLILGSMGSIFAEKALYGSDAVITNPAKSGRASGSESRGMRAGSCDFIFGAVRGDPVSLHELLGHIRIRRTCGCRPNVHWRGEMWVCGRSQWSLTLDRADSDGYCKRQVWG